MVTTVDRDLNDVTVFVQVVQSGSFTRAAETLGYPTSTVSRRVARLERALGTLLLQRTTRKLSLTDAGQLYFDRSSQVLGELNQVELALAQAQTKPTGRVRVAAPLELEPCMELVTSFLDTYPEIRVDLDLMSRQVNLVEEGYDVALQSGELPQSSLSAHKLMDSPFLLVASPEYIARRGEPSDPAALREHDCIVVGHSSSGTTWSLTGAKGPLRVRVRGRFAVNHLQAANFAALAGLGIALLPTVVCGDDVRSGRLQAVLQDAVPPPVPVWVVHPGGRLLTPAVQAFVDFLKTRFRGLVDPSLPVHSPRPAWTTASPGEPTDASPQLGST